MLRATHMLNASANAQNAYLRNLQKLIQDRIQQDGIRGQWRENFVSPKFCCAQKICCKGM